MTNKKNILPANDPESEEYCPDLPHVYLLVGQGGIYSSPTLVQTVLGSCVSVTMYCARYRWGGIFHALLPRMGDFPGRRVKGDHFRYVDSSIWYLLREFAKSGIAPEVLECKVFGGASPLQQTGELAAGHRNVQAAVEVLEQEGAVVTASSVGGNVGRKLFFRTDTGLVLQKRFQVSKSKKTSG